MVVINAEAKWICHPGDNKESRLVPVFRRCVQVGKNLRKAELSLSAHGLYDARINGKKVTDTLFNPRFTSYYFRIQYQTFDVTSLLEEGQNEWVTSVGDGWWRWNNNFGSRLAMIGSLRLIYENGEEVIVTDEDFEVTTGKLLMTDFQKGESIDARVQPSQYCPAMIETEHTDAELIPEEGVSVSAHESFEAKLIHDKAGNLVLDFGQNIAGFVSMKLHGTKPGQVVHLQHGEGLDLEGNFSVENCRSLHDNKVFQEITYICAGGEETYEPNFTYFGFRYVKIEGYDENKIQAGDFTAKAVYSDLTETGDFSCSNELINQLVKNARWSQKGNFLDVAVDCPTREKNSWTGDAQIYVRTAAYFMNVRDFFKKWMKDQTLEQYESGKVGITFPSTSSVHDPEQLKHELKIDKYAALAGPTGNGNIGEDSVGWGDAAVWIPWQIYLMYGDVEILKNQYETGRRWLEYSLRNMRNVNEKYRDAPYYQAETFGENDGNYIYDTLFHYGEWNEPIPPEPYIIEFFKNGGSPTDMVKYLSHIGSPEVATAYTKRSCDVMAAMAKILGKTEDADKYRELSRRIRYCYETYLVGDDGTIAEGHQAAYVRALALDMVSDKKPLVIARLKEEIEKADYHLNTGFLSTVYILPTLCENGLAEEAFRLLEQEGIPGWMHSVLMGGTTITENWDGLDKFEGSFNHYSLGAVCQFLFEYIAGIRPVETVPGFKEFELKPLAGGSLTWAEGYYDCSYGRISSKWTRNENFFTYECKVPEQTTAHLTLPNGDKKILQAGEYSFCINRSELSAK